MVNWEEINIRTPVVGFWHLPSNCNANSLASVSSALTRSFVVCINWTPATDFWSIITKQSSHGNRRLGLEGKVHFFLLIYFWCLKLDFVFGYLLFLSFDLNGHCLSRKREHFCVKWEKLNFFWTLLEVFIGWLCHMMLSSNLKILLDETCF